MKVNDLIKRYDGKAVVDSVSFQLPKGKVISLIGPNGAGKSTVMGMISRLIARDEGLIEFEEKELSKWKSKELAKRLAILTQQCTDEAYCKRAGLLRPVPLFRQPPAEGRY